MKINKRFYDKLRELEADGYGTEIIVHGGCRSVIRGTPAERLRLRALLLEMDYKRDLTRHGRCEIRDR